MSDEAFSVMREFLSSGEKASRETLEPEVEERSDEPHWIRERITFKAAYGNERVPVVLFLPKGFVRPYQVIVFGPGGGVNERSSSRRGLVQMDDVAFLCRSGRAVLCPILKGWYERAPEIPVAEMPRHLYVSQVRCGCLDLFRSLDYLETRPQDFDAKRIGWYGTSLGAQLGPMILALEDRIRTGVFVDGGLPLWPVPLCIDTLPHVPRVKVPVLMLNGLYDYLYPLKESQEPLAKLLGEYVERKTPYPSAHGIPDSARIKETLEWFDRHFGKPVPEGSAR